MVVAILKLRVHLFYSPNLKEKRSQIKRMLRRIRDKYGVAAAQIGDTEVRNVSELGFSFVSNDESYAQDVMNGVIREIEAKSEAEAVDIRQEMVHFG